MGKPGSAILKEIMAAPMGGREKLIYDNLRSRNVPSWQFQWRPVRADATIDGKDYSIEYMVAPDYLCLGDDEDYFRVPLTPKVAQAFADDMDAILPSRRMVDEIYAQANARLIPKSIAGNKATLEDWAKHEIMVQQQQKSLGIPGGTFLAGHKKDIVIGPNLDGSKVAIYGWHDESGALTGGKVNKPIQPYSTIHGWEYMDYAHGTRLVRDRARLNGDTVSLTDIFQDPKLSVLVSDQGAFKPRYPYGGTGQIASFARTSESPSSVVSRLAASASDAFQKGNDVVAAQRVLIALGYDLGASGADGVLGPMTGKAIGKFQVAEKLPVTSTLDAATKARLREKAVVLEDIKFGMSPKVRKVAMVAGGTTAVALGLGFLAKKKGWL